MEVNRYVRKDSIRSDGTCLIEFRLTWNGRKVRWSLGQNMRILHKLWDFNKQRVKSFGGDVVSAQRINEEMDRQERVALDLVRGYLAKGVVPTSATVSADLKKALGREKVEEVVNTPKSQYDMGLVLGSLKWWVEQHMPHRYAPATVVVYRSMKRSWSEFLPLARWDELSQDDLCEWVAMMVADGLTNDSIKQYLSSFKMVYDYCFDTGICSVRLRPRDIYLDSYDSVPVFHTIPEIMAIRHATYSKRRLRVMADLYLLAIGTGLRVSDLIRLSDAEVKIEGEGGYMTIVQRKTGFTLSVPMTNLAVEIWAKYGHNPAKEFWRRDDKKPHYCTYNAYLKEVGKEAGIDSQFVRRRKVGGQWVDESGPKWQFMSSHTARHTFAMVGLDLGIPVEYLQKVMGHTSVSSTLRYANVAPSVAGDAVKNKWNDLKL